MAANTNNPNPDVTSLLQGIYYQMAQAFAGGPALPLAQAPVAVVRTATLTSSTTVGSVAAGATTVSFANTGTASATVAGGTLASGNSITFNARYPDTLNSIAYTATGTTLLISTVA